MRRFTVPIVTEFAETAQPLCMPLFLGKLSRTQEANSDFYVLESIQQDLEEGECMLEYICHYTCQRLVFTIKELAKTLEEKETNRFFRSTENLSTRLFAFSCDKDITGKKVGYVFPPDHMRRYYEETKTTYNKNGLRLRFKEGAFAIPLHPFIIDRDRMLDPFDPDIEPSHLNLLKPLK